MSTIKEWIARARAAGQDAFGIANDSEAVEILVQLRQLNDFVPVSAPPAPVPHSQRTWELTLNSYQRDNLAWLLRVCGYPYGPDNVDLFGPVNNGDWLGEVALMLDCHGDPGSPNMTTNDLRNQVHWRIDQLKDED